MSCFKLLNIMIISLGKFCVLFCFMFKGVQKKYFKVIIFELIVRSGLIESSQKASL